jgi:hypothetical protein
MTNILNGFGLVLFVLLLLLDSRPVSLLHRLSIFGKGEEFILHRKRGQSRIDLTSYFLPKDEGGG